MSFCEQSLPGVFLFSPFRQSDDRGEFVKTFHKTQFAEMGHDFELREEFFSVSNKNVLRGMHFQLPPAAHQKVVYCVAGEILDVLLDLRRDQPTYGKTFSCQLSEENRQVLWIPVGIAHGFLSLRDGSCVVYKTDCEYSPQHDVGIRWDSFGYSWPETGEHFQLSPRDLKHPKFENFENFESPF